MKTIMIIALVAILILAVAGFFLFGNTGKTTPSAGNNTSGTGGSGNLGGGTGMANPASVYCVQQGGTLEIRDETGGQVGYCHFANGQVCEEWALFRSNGTNCSALD